MNIRLIADENISWRIKKLISWDILPVNEIKPGQRASDTTIWNFAKTNDYHILTFDEDFAELQNLYSYPPKVIWLRTGNLNTSQIATKLLSLEKEIADFLQADELGIYEIYI
jgi:predicted nuclease of predicted toxin-antitoxin system